MEQNENSLKDFFEIEVEKVKKETILSPEYRRKKTIIWGIRTFISIILFIIFWKYNWVRWVLIAYIPFNILSLVSIYGVNTILNGKMDKIKKKIDEIEELMDTNEQTPYNNGYNCFASWLRSGH